MINTLDYKITQPIESIQIIILFEVKYVELMFKNFNFEKESRMLKNWYQSQVND